jgi:hypothetical protein
MRDNLSRAPRWLFAAIPLGFLALVAVLVLLGQDTGGPTTSPYESGDILETGDAPALDRDTGDGSGPSVSPSGPEYEDNETILDE